jgi:uncharacterized protein YlxW (UPF0749 family)
MRRAWPLVILIAVLLGVGALAQSPSADGDARAAEARDAKWSARLNQAQMRLDQARQRVVEREAAYSKARHREYPRGAALAEIERDLEQARKDLAAAEHELPDLIEQARLAGVSPAVLLRFEPDQPDEPAAGAGD